MVGRWQATIRKRGRAVQKNIAVSDGRSGLEKMHLAGENRLLRLTQAIYLQRPEGRGADRLERCRLTEVRQYDTALSTQI